MICGVFSPPLLLWAINKYFVFISNFLEESNEAQVTEGKGRTQQSRSSGAATRTGKTTHS